MIQVTRERGYLAIALIALVLATAASPHLQARFERFLLGVPPWLAVIAAGALGFACLRWLDARGWRPAEKVGQGALVAAAAALFIFRRYGFLAMLMPRLTYYALWHVAWGYARLHW